MNTQRLATLLRDESWSGAPVLGAVAGFLNTGTEALKWRRLSQHLPRHATPEGLFNFKDGRPLPVVGEPEPHFAAWGFRRDPLRLRGNSQPLRPLEPENLLVQLRALCGVNVRAETIAYLLTHETGHPAEIARAAYYHKRTIQDVLALLDDQGRLLPSRPLPEAISRAVAEIASQLDLNPKWLNGGPTDLLKWGLPEGFQARLTPRNYGKALTVWYISRLDQIHSKVFAATDAGPGRHVNDLLALNPTKAELLAAARWALTQDASEGFVMILQDMLRELGHEDLANGL